MAIRKILSKTHWQVLGATILALLLAKCSLFDTGTIDAIDVLSAATTKLYIKILTLLAMPVVALAAVRGGMELGKRPDLAPRLFAYHCLTSLLAIAIGLASAQAIQPGIVDGEPALGAYRSTGSSDSIRMDLGFLGTLDIRKHDDSSAMIFRGHEILDAVEVGTARISILLACGLALGVAASIFRQRIGNSFPVFVEYAQIVAIRILTPVLFLTPVVAFSAVFQCAASEMPDLVWESLLKFMLAVLLALFLHSSVSLSLLLASTRRTHPFTHATAMSPALLRGFSTACSIATLPMTMECSEKNAKVDPSVSNFVLPVGTNFIRHGSVIYQVVSVLFIMQGSGVPIGRDLVVAVVAFGFITSAFIPSVPSGSILSIGNFLQGKAITGTWVDSEVMMGGYLARLHLGLGPILVVDRILDMFRTAVNIYGNSVGAVFVQGRKK